jgi:2-(1,2-epoxy-1,2-dihydrophenyl)acetyl-CoA isomerase
MPDVIFEKRADGVGLITLNRPEMLNSLGGDLVPLFADALVECDKDSSVRCVAITGAGRAFCAGGDVRNMQQRNEGMTDNTGVPANTITNLEAQVADLRRRQNTLSFRLHTMPKPVVALVNGHAVGAGLSIALACDLRIAGTAAKFGTAFRNVGLSGDFGGTYFLPRLVGAAKARELYFTAEILDATRALELGIVTKVVAQENLISEGLEFCAKLASGPTASLGKMKTNLNYAETHGLQESLDHEALLQRIAGMSQDSREAVLAFVEKRSPNFIGR